MIRKAFGVSASENNERDRIDEKPVLKSLVYIYETHPVV